MISREGLWHGRTKQMRLREKNEIKKLINGGLALFIGEVALNAFGGKFDNFSLLICYTRASVYEMSDDLGHSI